MLFVCKVNSEDQLPYRAAVEELTSTVQCTIHNDHS